MRTKTEKITPFLLILIGGLKLLTEMFPRRLAFLSAPIPESLSWLFWTLAIAGIVWLILRRMPEKDLRDVQSSAGSFLRKYGVEILILITTAASLAMLIRSGFFWDDSRNSTRYLAEKKDSVSTLTHVLAFMRTYLRLGRINVLSVYYYFFFYIENVSVYKALIIALILINQLIFRKTLLEFDVPSAGARLGMLLIPFLLQTRIYQDPVSGFYGLMQILTAEMLLTALFLSRWLRSGQGRDLACSLLFFGIGLMTYEVCFPFLAMICLLIWVRRKHFLKALRDSLPYLALVMLMLAAVFLVRQTIGARSTYAGVSFSLKPDRILRAALTQITAGLPLSYYSSGYQSAVLDRVYQAASFLNYDFKSFLSAIELTDLLILASAVILLAKIRSSLTRAEEKMPDLLLLGLSFAILPAVTVAISQRYQGQLMPGLGYLPVYMQYFGIASLLVWLTLRLRPTAGVRALCLSVFAVGLLLNLQNNRAVTDILNRFFYDPRNAGEAALQGGILDFLPEDAVLLSDNDRRYLWEADWNNHGLYTKFYGNNSRFLPASVGDNKVLRKSVNDALEGGAVPDEEGYLLLRPENIWMITYNGGPDRGFARLGRIIELKVNPDTLTITDPVTDRVLYFISGESPEQAGVQYTGADGDFFRVGPEEQLRIRASGKGILYQLPENLEIRFDSLVTDLIYR